MRVLRDMNEVPVLRNNDGRRRTYRPTSVYPSIHVYLHKVKYMLITACMR